MTYEDYKKELDLIKKDAAAKEDALIIKFVNSNNPHKIGDVVTDNIGSIIIDKIKCSRGATPCAVYYGVELTKKGQPNRRGERRGIYQSDLIAI